MLERYLENKGKRVSSFVNFFILSPNQFKCFKYLCLFSCLYLLPLVLAHCHYIDDVGRFANTEFNWMKDGRPLMQCMAKCLSFGNPYLDIIPLGQLMGAVLLNYVLVLWGRKYIAIQKPLFLAGVLAVSYLNLFLLETFSYVYEVIGMTVSLCFAILLYSFSDTDSFIKQFVPSMVLVILSMSFYQASIGAYVGLAVIEVCHSLWQGESQRKIVQQLISRVTGIAAGLLFIWLL